jgi:phage shock protein A
MGLFSRLSRLVKGFFGLFVSGLEERNPKALLEVAKQEFSERIASANNGLAKMAGVVSRLQMQIKLGTRKATELQDRILANYHAGNAELAGSLARELQDVKNDLTENASELKESEESYQNYLRQVKVFGKEYEE